eukprot:1146036-Pleurochrysis_carterae.AAC.1
MIASALARACTLGSAMTRSASGTPAFTPSLPRSSSWWSRAASCSPPPALCPRRTASTAAAPA